MKHKTFYFDDGNIILRVKKDATDSHVLFRVHQSVLKLHSSTLASILTIPPPAIGSASRELIDGCDVIDMHDPYQDMEKLISLLYGKPAPAYKRLTQQSFDYFAPVIRLSDKYGISHLFEKYISHVVEGWPKTLGEWKSFDEEVKQITQQAKISKASENLSVVHPACMIRIAEDYSQSTILPAAYYDLSRLPQGIRKTDGTHNTGTSFSTKPSLRSPELETLYSGQYAMRRYLIELAVTPRSILSTWPISPISKHKVNDQPGTPRQCQPSEWCDPSAPDPPKVS
ncbi:hypothetical protein FRC02_011665 [Tulasnella sp. 418]|nr:hypothetical protein FRC02_011665 [Tulasnella sp. 418]